MKPEDCIDYALGEMREPRREAFERELADSPELLQSLEETAAWLDTLRKASRPTEALDATRREFLLAACRSNISTRWRRAKILRLAVPLSLAAVALFGLLLAHPGPGPFRNASPLGAESGSLHYEVIDSFIEHAAARNPEGLNYLLEKTEILFFLSPPPNPSPTPEKIPRTSDSLQPSPPSG